MQALDLSAPSIRLHHAASWGMHNAKSWWACIHLCRVGFHVSHILINGSRFLEIRHSIYEGVISHLKTHRWMRSRLPYFRARGSWHFGELEAGATTRTGKGRDSVHIAWSICAPQGGVYESCLTYECVVSRKKCMTHLECVMSLTCEWVMSRIPAQGHVARENLVTAHMWMRHLIFVLVRPFTRMCVTCLIHMCDMNETCHLCESGICKLQGGEDS